MARQVTDEEGRKETLLPVYREGDSSRIVPSRIYQRLCHQQDSSDTQTDYESRPVEWVQTQLDLRLWH